MKLRKHFSLAPMHSYNFTAIEHKLETISKKGWMPEELTSLLWRFRPVEPKARRFQVVYTWSDTPAEIEYYDRLFQPQGWTLEAFMDHVLIFCHEDSDAPKVFVDPQVQFNAIHALRGRPTLWIFLLSLVSLILKMVASSYQNGLQNLIPILLDTTELTTVLIATVLIFVELLQWLQYALWHQQAKVSMKAGDPLPSFSDWSSLYHLLLGIDVLICLLAAAYTIATGGLFTVIALALTIASALVMGLILYWKLTTRDIPRAITAAISIVVPSVLVIISALCWAPLNNDMAAPTQCKGLVFDSSYTHVFPMTLKELTDGEYTSSQGYYHGQRSFFVQEIYSNQWTGGKKADKMQEFEIRLTYHQLPQLRRACLDYHRNFLALRNMHSVETGDCTLWQAQTVNVYRNDETGKYAFLVEWPDKVVTVQFSQLPDESMQKKTAARLREHAFSLKPVES